MNEVIVHFFDSFNYNTLKFAQFAIISMKMTDNDDILSNKMPTLLLYVDAYTIRILTNFILSF